MFSRAQQLEVEEEYYAKQDDIRERYNCQIQDLMHDQQTERWYTEYMTKVWDAGYGYDSDAYEAYWSRVEDYFKNEPEDSLF